MKKVYVSRLAAKELIEYLKNVGRTPVIVNGSGKVYKAVDCHPDIYYWKTSPVEGKVIHGNEAMLGTNYPQNIIYNAVLLDRYLIHNLRYTAAEILDYGKENGLKPINVKQGYTKCSCAVVDGQSLITSDPGIYKVLSEYHNINVLKIREGFISLPGHDHGFIGGTSGRVGDRMVFNGDLESHPDFKCMYEFIRSRGVEPVYFKNVPLTDIGSIIED